MSIAIKLLGGSFGAGYQPASWQELFDRIVALMSATADADTTFKISTAEPTSEDRDKIWARIDGANALDKLYTYSGGAWVSRHLILPNSPERRIFRGSLSALEIYDGGDTNPPGPASGPMWEEDTDFIYRFPLHAGPTASDAGLVVNQGDTGGEQTHVLTGAESGTSAHTHPLAVRQDSFTASGDTLAVIGTSDPGNAVFTTGMSLEAPARHSNDGGDTFVNQPHNNMPPYLAVYFVRRTSRTFYLPG